MTYLIALGLFALGCLIGYGLGYEHGWCTGWNRATKLVVRFFEVPDTSPDGSPLSYTTIEELTK